MMLGELCKVVIVLVIAWAVLMVLQSWLVSELL